MNTEERMKNLIGKFVLKGNYWGYLFSRVRRIPMDNLPSIAGVAPESDGTISLYYNSKLFKKTDDENFLYVLEHEGLHILNQHITRLLRILNNEFDDTKKELKSKIWNIAADCCCNSQAGLPRTIIIAEESYILQFPDLYNLPNNKTAEWYFNKLLDQKNKNGKEEIGNDLMIGDHSRWAAGSEQLKSVTDISALSRKIDSYVSNIITESSKTFNKQKGNIPGYIAELIQEILKPPKLPYYQIIKKLIRGSRLSKFKRSPTRINRKRTYVFQIDNNINIPSISPFPGRTRDFSFNIVLLIDTSGSMSIKDILEGLSGVRNIIENDKNCKLTVLENDAKLQKEYQVKRIQDIDFKIKGRGGTILKPGLQRAKELNPDVTLVFTDGDTDNINSIPKNQLPKKIIWVIQKNGTVKNVNKTGFIVKI